MGSHVGQDIWGYQFFPKTIPTVLYHGHSNLIHAKELPWYLMGFNEKNDNIPNIDFVIEEGFELMRFYFQLDPS